METIRIIRTRILILLMALTLICTWAMLPDNAYADDQEPQVHYIATGSDRHEDIEAISNAMAGMPKEVEYVCLNGDMASMGRGNRPKPEDGEIPSETDKENFKPNKPTQNSFNTSVVLEEVQEVFPALDNTTVSIVYGTHDANATDDAGIIKCADASLLPSADASDHPEISAGQSGLIYTGYDGDKPAYYIYGISFYDVTDPGSDDPDAAGSIRSAEEFKRFADEHPDVPIIAIGHVPLHAIRKDNLGATYWNDALNYAATGSVTGTKVKRAVAYLHGHNHTVEKTEYFIEPGGTMFVQGTSKDDQTESAIYYTYMTSGYLRNNVTASLVCVYNGTLSFDKYEYGKYAERPNRPEMTASVNVDAKSITLKWEGVKYASDYRASYKPVGWVSWIRYWSNGARSYTFTGLDAGELYDLKVTAAAELSDQFIYSSDSAIQHRYISKGSGIKAKSSSKTGKVTVSWKKDSKATEYQVKYADNKNMKNATTVKVSGDKKSYTFKKLKSGKKYYASVRPIVTRGNMIYYGNYSAKAAA